MSILDADELALLDVVTIKTRVGKSDVTVSTPKAGCLVRLTGADGRPLDWQTRPGAGLSGMTQVFKSKGLAEFGIELRMWGEDEDTRLQVRGGWEQFDQIVEAPPPGQPAKVYEIQHPLLALRGITQCVFLNEPLLEHDADAQYDRIAYKCREWRKPLPTLASPTAPGAGTVDGKAVDEFTARIEAKLGAFQALAQQNGIMTPPNNAVTGSTGVGG